MKRIIGIQARCERCGLVHDTKGRTAAACLAWDGAIRSGTDGAVTWEALLVEVNRP